MLLGLLLRRIKARTFEHDVDPNLSPRNVRRVRFSEFPHPLAVDKNILFVVSNVMIILSLRGIILQKVRQHFRLRQIVNRRDLKPRRAEHVPKRQPPDPSEPVDCYLYRH